MMSKMILIVGPSGVGKDTLADHLVDIHGFYKVISTTTRDIRPGEIDDKDYHFIDYADFKSRLALREFIESAEVFGKWYGTLRSETLGKLENGMDLVMVIDWQGARRMRKILENNGHKHTTIYVLPTSYKDLKSRLISRGNMNEELIESRMSKAFDEVVHFNESNYIVINDYLPDTLNSISSIVIADSLRTRDMCISDEVDNIVSDIEKNVVQVSE